MKQFLFVLFCVLPIYAMEDEKALLGSASKGFKKSLTTQEVQEVNRAFSKAVAYAIQNPSQEAFEKIENCLNQGANVNSQIGFYGETAIIFAVENSNKNLFDFLLHHKADINSKDGCGKTPLYIALTKKPACFDIEKDFLKRDANPNAKTVEGEGALLHSTIIEFGTINSIKLLIKHGAKIDKKDFFGRTPLNQAIVYCNFEAIEELCNRGARLDDINSYRCNAFHQAIAKKLPKKYINLLITNSRFDSYNKEVDEQLEKIVLETLLIFKKLNNMPHFPKILVELQWHILSYLALNNLYGFNKKLCQQLKPKNIKNILLTYTLTHVNCLENMLQSKNMHWTATLDKTALQDLHKEHQNDPQYIQEIEPLVDPKKLQQDRIDFINGTTQEDNLVAQIYEQSKKLLLES